MDRPDPAASPAPSASWLSRARDSHGVRSGAFLGVAILVLSGSGYLFNVACIRYLGPSGYGDVAALMALAAIAVLPLGSIQLLIAREVAGLSAWQAHAEMRRLLRRSLSIAVPLAVLLYWPA